jgi:hypothetical protein
LVTTHHHHHPLGVTNEIAIIDIFTAVRTSNLLIISSLISRKQIMDLVVKVSFA